ncbi:alpha/beta-hydrolase [Dichomitus squalens LYAD-421 SS1]|uniref:alpha/beta-hydrolase n=1 Tax=Dichomitus squalens (strain LYAD-421) TaxID=732165 RepID=UPI000441418D|nr:alpha/beta-hydrolase [Dichomitus squalens LYAD-421 SS1]EJF64379.1 alpha/beta-hydrolase [Dichomitus squalens LYAD-421 SS1]
MGSSFQPVIAVILLAVLSSVLAVPTSTLPVPQRRQENITPLARTQVSSFKPYTNYASTAYCEPANTLAWNCGPNCQANPSFIPIASGGDGVVTQFWFVGYDPTLNEIIVSHQGTDVSKIVPALTDALTLLGPLDLSLFPGMTLPIQVHTGFAATHASSAPQVLAAVQEGMDTYGATRVTTTGHSLGAAIALLDAVFLPLHLPNGTVMRFVGYGTPRVGDQDFANYVDAQNLTVTHINNKDDPVPILPLILLGFHHPQGEVRIESNGVWNTCPGQDNPSTECSTGSVNLIFNNEFDHDGPYDGVTMGCSSGGATGTAPTGILGLPIPIIAE